MKTIKLNGEYTKKELEKKLEELKKPKIEFKINENNGFNYQIVLYINDKPKWNMSFDNNSPYSNKLYQFNNLIEKAIFYYGGKENFAKQKDLNDTKIVLYGFGINNIFNNIGFRDSKWIEYSYMNNKYSKSEEVAEDIYEAYKPVIEYTNKAFRGE